MSRKFLTPIDLGQNELQNARVQNLASDPGSPVAGQIWFNTTSHLYKFYDGTSVQVVGTSSATGTVTAVSVASANGFAGTVASSTTTPAITISTSVSGLLKGNGTSVSAATSGTDYAPATSGSALLKGNGSGGFSSASSGTDYAPATSGSSILKGNGSGGFTSATSSTDYAPATTGSSALKGNGSGGFTAAVLNDVGAATGDYSLNSHKITSLADPTSAQDAATKNYVDATAQGLNAKPSALVVATANITLSGTQTIDGVGVVAGNRVLATGQSTASQNGLWVVASGAWTRPVDFAAGSSQLGSYVFVEGGTANASSGWVLVATSAVTVDTTSQAWTQFSGAGEITAGTGLAKSGNTLSIENSGVLTVPHGGTGAATLTGLVKGNGTSAFTAATSGTDYAPATSGSAILKGNGSGGFSSAASGTDYAPATSGSALLKGNGSGGFSSATAGTDYAAATSGSSILKGNGSGGFSSAKYTATIGDGSSTSIAVTHSLGTQDVIAQIRDASTNAVVDCDITQTSTTVTTFAFATAPATNAYKVVIIG